MYLKDHSGLSRYTSFWNIFAGFYKFLLTYAQYTDSMHRKQKIRALNVQEVEETNETEYSNVSVYIRSLRRINFVVGSVVGFFFHQQLKFKFYIIY